MNESMKDTATAPSPPEDDTPADAPAEKKPTAEDTSETAPTEATAEESNKPDATPDESASGEAKPEGESADAAGETPAEGKEAPAEGSEEDKEEGGEEGKEEAPAKEFNWGDGLDLKISNDKLTAWLTVDVESAPHYTANSLGHYLTENKIEFGIDQKMLEKILSKHLFNEKQVVAKGNPAQHGEDGYVEWKIDLSVLEGAALVERGGRVNYKERHKVLQVEEGQLMALLFEPTEGTDGKNLMGEAIACKPGKPAKFPNGKNTLVGDGGNEMHAAAKGIVCKEGEKVSVSPVYEVQGDVNYATGNITFDHSVVITGGVLVDFEVKSGQDVHINGLVEGAKIEALGSVYINGGVQGDEKAVIKAGGEIQAKFINGAKLIAEGNITIAGLVTNSTLECRDTITLDGNKGIVMGGHLRAEKCISVEVAGSESEVKTHLLVGPDLSKMVKARKEEHGKLESLMQNYKKLQQAVGALDKMQQSGRQLTPEQGQMRLKLIRAGLQVQGQVKSIKEKVQQVDAEMKNRSENIHGVIVRDKAFPGTHVTILGNTLPVRALTTKAQFNVVDKEVEVFAIKEDKKK